MLFFAFGLILIGVLFAIFLHKRGVKYLSSGVGVACVGVGMIAGFLWTVYLFKF